MKYPSLRRPLLAVVLISLLAAACGSGSGFRDDEDVCEALVAALGDNDPARLVALLPDEEALRLLTLARAWEQSESGESRVADEKIRRFVLDQVSLEWAARASERAAERARQSRELALALDRVRELLGGNPRRRDLQFRRFRDEQGLERYGDRELAEAELRQGVLRFRYKGETEYSCRVSLAEVNRRWFLLDFDRCTEEAP